jgi:hypothetical protein
MTAIRLSHRVTFGHDRKRGLLRPHKCDSQRVTRVTGPDGTRQQAHQIVRLGRFCPRCRCFERTTGGLPALWEIREDVLCRGSSVEDQRGHLHAGSTLAGCVQEPKCISPSVVPFWSRAPSAACTHLPAAGRWCADRPQASKERRQWRFLLGSGRPRLQTPPHWARAGCGDRGGAGRGRKGQGLPVGSLL